MSLFFIDWAIRSTVLLALGLAGGALLRRKAPEYRHALLAVTLVCAALLPALRPLMPAWRLPVAVAVPKPAAQAPAPTPVPAADFSVAAALPPFDTIPILPEDRPRPAAPPRDPQRLLGQSQ